MPVAWYLLIVRDSLFAWFLSLSFEVVRIPGGSFLAPSRTAAVCGGNVLTSQRIVDVVLRAFHACAASQGCTNNLTFGAGGKDSDGRAVPGWGYYEVRGCVYIYIFHCES